MDHQCKKNLGLLVVNCMEFFHCGSNQNCQMLVDMPKKKDIFVYF